MVIDSQLNSSLYFYRSYGSLNEIKNIKNSKIGDVVIDNRSTNYTYYWSGSEWELICDSYVPEETEETITEITDMKCKNCGAPLIRYNKNARTVKCEYCDSVFDIKEIQYGSKLSY